MYISSEEKVSEKGLLDCLTSDYDLPTQGYNNWMVTKYGDEVDNNLFIDFIDVHLKCQLVVTINI